MATQSLEKFLRDLSADPTLRAASQEDREKVMARAQLSDVEKELIRKNDEAAIKQYLGDNYLAGIAIALSH